MTGRRAALLAALALLGAAPAAARTVPRDFQDQLVAGGLHQPVGFAFIPDGRILVIERAGLVRLVVNGKLGVVDPLLAVDSVDAAAPEGGLLGIAVDPAWPSRPYFYVASTRLGQTLRIERYRAAGDLDDANSVFLTVDPASRRTVLRDVPNLDPGRNGGGLRFAPDGMLLAGLGDDGAACSAQDTTSLRGVLLRLDVSKISDSAGGAPPRGAIAAEGNPWAAHPQASARLVWSIGLRDPWRFAVDPRDGTVLIGDVGATHQEIDAAPAAAANFGWPFAAGAKVLEPPCPPLDSAALAPPVHAYESAGTRVVGGGVYVLSGCGPCDFPAAYDGDYFFADRELGVIRRLETGSWTVADSVPGQPSAADWASGFTGVSDLAPGPDGALWYCLAGSGGATGALGRIVHYPDPLSSVGAPPPGTALSPSLPSPTPGATRWSFRLERRATVRLDLLDPAGRRVRRLLGPAPREAGAHVVRWDGRLESGVAAPPGVYLAVLVVDGAPSVRRVVVAR